MSANKEKKKKKAKPGDAHPPGPDGPPPPPDGHKDDDDGHKGKDDGRKDPEGKIDKTEDGDTVDMLPPTWPGGTVFDVMPIVGGTPGIVCSSILHPVIFLTSATHGRTPTQNRQYQLLQHHEKVHRVRAG